jgi:hypothetical protein
MSILAGSAVAFAPAPVMADGLDVVAYLTRVPPVGSKPGTIGIVAAMMVVNYALNFLVIGLPAIRVAFVRLHLVCTGLVVLTLLGQLADRVGALAAVLLAQPVADLLGLTGEGAWAWPLLGLNFLFSGVAVGVLAFYFLRRRWKVAGRASWVVAGAAAVFTNPAWAIGLGLWFT